MDDLARAYLRGLQHHAYSRRAMGSDSEVMLPTLAHVPGVEIKGRYSTKVLRMRGRQAVTTPHAALKKPRILHGGAQIARIVHLGGGRTLHENVVTMVGDIATAIEFLPIALSTDGCYKKSCESSENAVHQHLATSSRSSP